MFPVWRTQINVFLYIQRIIVASTISLLLIKWLSVILKQEPHIHFSDWWKKREVHDDTFIFNTFSSIWNWCCFLVIEVQMLQIFSIIENKKICVYLKKTHQVYVYILNIFSHEKKYMWAIFTILLLRGNIAVGNSSHRKIKYFPRSVDLFLLKNIRG